MSKEVEEDGYPPLTEADQFERGPCGCAHERQDKVTDQAATGGGRRLSAVAEDVVGEPLMAVAEDDGSSVLGCGSCGDHAGLTQTVIPNSLRLERFAKSSNGTYESVGEHSVELSKDFQDAWDVSGSSNHSCLPWVRITRDPTRFKTCLAAARALGPIKYPKDFYKLVRGTLVKEDQEVFLVLLLDTQLQVRGVSEISRGARDSVQTPIPDILRLPIVDGARAIVVAHNHPSGKVDPSKADKALTASLAEACSVVGIDLFDHLIVGPDKYFSFYDSGLLK